MKAVLRQRIRLDIDPDRRWQFVALKEPSAPGEEAGETGNRFLRWLVNRYTKIRQGMASTDQRWLKGVDAALARLESRVEPMETLLMQSRKAAVVSIHHPAGITPSLVERRFRRLIRRGVRKSKRGILINLAVLPFCLVMSLFPGPNIFLGWSAYRLFSHYLAREGGKRILSGQCPIETVPDKSLAEVPEVSPSVSGS
ncbi:MAG: hypothetical protein HY650_03120 [Acidobacteria bacterium]|nr:hypothetical protein [Acidobacteriota bacterium]